jgi:glycosyltransferase XagB
MSASVSILHPVKPAVPVPASVILKNRSRKPLGQVLLERRAVDPGDMLKAIALRRREDALLGDILLAHGWISEADLMSALCEQWNAEVIDLSAMPPDQRLAEQIDPDLCLSEACIPWRRIGGATIIATARPDDFERLCTKLAPLEGPFLPALATERQIHAALTGLRGTDMIRRAETRVPAADSCRGHDPAATGRFMAAVLAGLGTASCLYPGATVTHLIAWSVVTLILTSGLKLAAFAAELLRPKVPVADTSAPHPHLGAPARLPMVSMLVPMFAEADIAPRLIARLGRIDYPRELLDIILIAEAGDALTIRALTAARLPSWMRVVTVPDGPIRTKPRALNYALGFARGSIVGVWDAEDAPEPAQLHKVARRFAEAGPEVACLQGILDFYNARQNWLSRCFAVEYAAWFRVMLPGLARLGFAIPLGGTTLFFRRAALDRIGGWDAHNVTEDADLGIRLARRGYRTELIATVTEEEPNARAIPWVKQRSRWLKGYAMTWAVHMRDPLRLLRDLGPKRFAGMQVLFLGTLSQFILAPVLWAFWMLALIGGEGMRALLSQGLLTGLSMIFVLSELLSMAVGIYATRRAGHRHLMKWVPTLMFYFPLGTLAAAKALYEMVMCPFFWDKTRHGVFDGAAAAEVPDQPVVPDHTPSRTLGGPQRVISPLVLSDPLPVVPVPASRPGRAARTSPLTLVNPRMDATERPLPVH